MRDGRKEKEGKEVQQERGMEQRRQMRRSTVETRDRKEEEEGKGVQQRRGMKERREKGMNYSKDEG
jgi:hypothetical protein